MNLRILIVAAFVSIIAISCAQNHTNMKPYVIEVTTFKYKKSVDANTFWSADADVESGYTSKQPGYISRESGYAKNDNEVVVVVRWKTLEDAEASMKKFMGDESVKSYANMIDGPTMKMSRYEVK